MNKQEWKPVSIADICKAYGIPFTRPSSHPMSDEYKDSFHPQVGAGIGLLKLE